jgi:hypothetical protein
MASFRHDQGWEQGGRETAGKPSISPVLRVELCTVVLHCPYRPALMLSRRSGTKRVSSSIRPSDDKAGTRSRHARALREARPSPRPSVERFLRQRRGQFRVGELRMFALRRLGRSWKGALGLISEWTAFHNTALTPLARDTRVTCSWCSARERVCPDRKARQVKPKSKSTSRSESPPVAIRSARLHHRRYAVC